MGFDFEKMSVLVVDDQWPMRKLVCTILETLGVKDVYEAHSGEEGFELFRKHNPDVVITDWMMETGNGLELTDQIRNNMLSPNRTVPIILITGYSAMQRVAKARDTGVTEFLVKPFSSEDLAKRLDYVITRPRDFIENKDYFGPERRRKRSSDFQGPFRREDDSKNPYLVG